MRAKAARGAPGIAAEAGNVAAGQRRPDQIGAARVDVLDAAVEQQAGGLAITAVGGQRVGLAEQTQRRRRFGPPVRLAARRRRLRVAPPSPAGP